MFQCLLVLLSSSCLLVAAASVVDANEVTETESILPSFIKRGRCSIKSDPIVHFDRNKFSGRWFRIGGIYNPEEEDSVKCTTYDYSTTATGMSVRGRGVDANGLATDEVKDVLMSYNDIARLNFTANGRKVSMDVIETDYTAYACLTACVNVVDTHYALFAWMLNRKPDFDFAVVSACQVAMQLAGIPVGDLRGTVQGAECSYPPEL